MGNNDGSYPGFGVGAKDVIRDAGEDFAEGGNFSNAISQIRDMAKVVRGKTRGTMTGAERVVELDLLN